MTISPKLPTNDASSFCQKEFFVISLMNVGPFSDRSKYFYNFPTNICAKLFSNSTSSVMARNYLRIFLLTVIKIRISHRTKIFKRGLIIPVKFGDFPPVRLDGVQCKLLTDRRSWMDD